MNSWVSHGGKPDLQSVLDADARARRLAEALLPAGTPLRSMHS
jgi:hypothetical protein